MTTKKKINGLINRNNDETNQTLIDEIFSKIYD